MRRALLLVLAAAALLAGAGPAAALLAGAGPAAAVPPTATVADVVAALAADPLFVSPLSTVTPDTAAVRRALRATRVPTYAVVVPQADADAEQLGIDGFTLQVLERLRDPRAVVVVVTDGQELQAADGGQAGVDASEVLDQVLQARLDEPFGPATLTGALVDFARLVDEGSGPPPTAAGRSEGSTRRTVGLVGLVAVAALGGGGWLYARMQRRLLASAPLTKEDLTPREPGWQGVTDR